MDGALDATQAQSDVAELLGDPRGLVREAAAKLGIDPLVIRRKNLPPNNPKATDKVSWAARRHDIYTEQLDLIVKL